MSQFAYTNPLSLNEGEVQIWLLDIRQLQSQLSTFYSWLDENERVRANRYFFAVDRTRFVVSRGGLRYLLGSYFQQSPQSIIFNSHPHGKPFLESPIYNEMEFNLSHSQDLILIAMSKRIWVGIDIEYHRESVEFSTIAERYFTKNEYIWWSQLPSHQQTEAFFKLWSSKEAVVKGLGLGLSYPLTSFDVLQSPFVKLTEKKNDMPEEWYVENFIPEDKYSAAIAVGVNKHPYLRWYRLSDEQLKL